MNDNLKISIGIAAYNAEKNIGQMLGSLLAQDQDGFDILEIIVHCDNCTDQTVNISRELNNNRIKVIDNKTRRGFAGSAKALLETSSGDIIILLNDDIKITDNSFIKKLVAEFKKDPSVGLVSGNPQPLPPQTFVERAIISTFRAYENTRYAVNGGHNPNSCDGKILALSKQLKDLMLKKESFTGMGNVDGYFYMFCVENHLKFRHASTAIVYYRNPQNFKDFVKWFTRNDSQKPLMSERFGPAYQREFHLPLGKLLFNCFVEAVKNPFGAVFLFFSRFYIDYKVRKYEKNFGQTWDVVASSKKI